MFARDPCANTWRQYPQGLAETPIHHPPLTAIAWASEKPLTSARARVNQGQQWHALMHTFLRSSSEVNAQIARLPGAG